MLQPERHAAQHHRLRRRRDRLRVRVDLPRPAHQGEPGQQPRQAAGVPRRRDHRRARLSPARQRRADPPQRGVRARRGRRRRRACCTSRPARRSRATCCCGRRAAPATRTGLGLEDDRRRRRTSAARSRSTSPTRPRMPHIYAVGDVVGYPSLASAAYDQGRFAATHVADRRVRAATGARTFRPASTPSRRSARSARPSAS